MSTFDGLRKMALSYPESSPFDMNPPLHNLRPESVQDPLILDEVFVDMVKDEARSQNNPFDSVLGNCPLLFGPDAVPHRPPLPSRSYPPLTPFVAEEFEFRVLKLLTRHRTLTDGVYDGPMVYKIKVEDKLRVMKVVRYVED